ncbi:MAG: PAS domain S-box protein [Pseudanabaenaceae cyanobacterium]
MPQRILEQLQVGVVVQNAQSEILYVNSKACELLGLTREQFLGKTSLDPDWNVIHPDGRPMPGHEHPVSQAIRTGEPVNGVVMGVYRPQTRDRVWILVDALPELAANGQVVQAIATFTDITAQIQLEQSLQGLVVETGAVSGEGFFAALVRQVAAVTGVAHVVLAEKRGPNLETLAVWADGQLHPNFTYAIAGTPCAETLEQGFYQCHTNLQETFPHDKVLGYLQSQSYVGVALRDRQGETIMNLCVLHRESLSPHLLSWIEPLLQLFAQRAAAEWERQLLERRFETFMDNLPALAYFKDADGKVQFVNRYCAQVLGQTPETMVGRRCEDFCDEELASLIDHDHLVWQTQQPHIFEEVLRGIPCLAVKFPMKDGGVGGIAIDLSDRRRAEQALAESEERRRLALELTHTGSWEFEVATGEAIWSDSHYQLMGLTPGSVPANCETWRARVHPEDLAATEAAIQRALADRTLCAVEYRVVWPDGTERWVLTQGQGLYDAAGNPHKMVGVMTDITDRKRMELALRRSETLLQEAQQTAQLGSWEFDPATERIHWSHQTFLLLGFDPTQPEPTFAELQRHIHPDDRESHNRHVLAAIHEGTPYTLQFRAVMPNGTIRHLEAIAKVEHRKGVVHRLYGSVMDISERIAAQQALAASEERYRQIVEMQTEFILRSRPDTRLTFVNQSFANLLARSTNEVLGLTWAAVVAPEDLAPLLAKVAHLTPENPLFENHNWLVRADGQRIWTEWINRGIFNAAGELQEIQSVGRDVTAVRDLEHRLCLTLQAARMSIWDVDWRTQRVKLINYLPDDILAQGSHFQDIPLAEFMDTVSHADNSAVQNLIAELLREPQKHSFDLLVQSKTRSGELRWQQVLGEAQRNEQGELLGALGVTIDIHDRRLAELSLQESQERLARILHLNQIGTWEWDWENHTLYWDTQVYDLLGIPHEETPSYEKFLAKVHPEDVARVEASTQKARVTGEASSIEYRVRPGDGTVRWLMGKAEVIQRQRTVGILLDITDRKQIEMALQASEAKLQAFLNNSPAIIYIKGLDGRYQWVNQEFERVLAMPAATVCGQTDFDFLPAPLAESIVAHDRQALTHRQTVVSEETAIVADGQLHTYFVTKFPLLDGQGHPYALAGISIDITDRKQAELELQQQKQFLSEITSPTLAILYIFDLIEQRNVFVNPDIQTVLGYTPEEVQALGNQLFSTLVHPDDLPHIIENLHRNLMTSSPPAHAIELEYRMRHKDGSWRWLLSRDRVFAYTAEGKPKQILGVATDITYLKETQLALQESEARFRSLANNLPGAVLRYVLHPDGTDRLVYISPGCEKLWELPRETVLANAETAWCLLLPEDVLGLRTSIAQSAQTLSTWHYEWRIRLPSGGQKWLSGIGEPQRHPNGDVVWDTIILDVSDRKRSQEELEALVAKRTQSLLESQKFLRQQLEREKLLLAVTNRIRASMDLQDILDRTVAEIQELLKCDRALIYKILEDGSGVTIAEARVPAYSSFLGTVFDPEVLPPSVQEAYKAGRIGVLSDSKGLSPCMVDFMNRYQIRSKLVVPLIVGADLWGLMVMQHCAQSHVWEDWEIELMSQLSVSLAIAIRQSELFEQVQSELQARRQAETALQSQAAADRLLATIAQRIGQSPYLVDVLDSTLETLRQFLQVDRVIVYRFLPDWSGRVECEAVNDLRLSLAGQQIQDPCLANPARQERYRRGEVDVVSDVRAQGEPCYQDFMAQFQVRAKLVAPIVQGEELWGLILAHDCQKARRWTDQESQLLAQVATQIGIAGQKENLFARIQQELQQKETLLKEVHHRVKNNLQIVISLMRLQGDSNGNPALQTALWEGQNRIQTMALIHERLYRSNDLSQIDARTYFTELTQYLTQTYNACEHRIALALNIEPISLGIDQAVPCGLIVNELVSNAFKYAFGGKGGTITVTLTTAADHLYLRVSDNGQGLPVDFDQRRSASLGLRLVDRLVRQLSGKLLVQSNPGADFTICFPWHP